jgi:hypothetical protein
MKAKNKKISTLLKSLILTSIISTGIATFAPSAHAQIPCPDGTFANPKTSETCKSKCEATGGTWVVGGNTGNTADPDVCNKAAVPKDEAGCKAKSGTWKNGACTLPSKDFITKPPAPDPVDRKDCDQPKIDETNCGIVKYVNQAFSLISGVVILGVIANIIISGIMYSMSQGDSGATAKAKARIVQAVLAMFLYFSLYAFVQWLIPGGVF